MSELGRYLRENPRLRVGIAIALLVNSVSMAVFFSLRLYADEVGSPQPRLLEVALLVGAVIALVVMMWLLALLIRLAGMMRRTLPYVAVGSGLAVIVFVALLIVARGH